VRRLDQVLEHVLPVRRAVAQQTHRADEFRMQIGDADLGHRVLGRALAQFGDLALAPLVDLLDPTRVDPAVQHQRVQRQPRGLPAYRVEAGQQHRLGGVVDDQVDAGGLLERPDVAALAADDPALHVVAGQVHDRHDRLAGLFRREPLDGTGDDLAGLDLALVLGLALDVANDRVRVPLRLRLERGDQFGLGLLAGQVRDAFEDPPALVLQVADLGALPVELGELSGELVLPLLDPAQLLVEALLPLGQPVLAPFHLEALLPQVVANRLRLGLSVPPYDGRPLLGLPPDLRRAVLGLPAHLVGALLDLLRAHLRLTTQFLGLLLGLAADFLGPLLRLLRAALDHRGLVLGLAPDPVADRLRLGDRGRGLQLRVRLGGGHLGALAPGQRQPDPGEQPDHEETDDHQTDGRRRQRRVRDHGVRPGRKLRHRRLPSSSHACA
jgi:hypothetical protein